MWVRRKSEKERETKYSQVLGEEDLAGPMFHGGGGVCVCACWIPFLLGINHAQNGFHQCKLQNCV